MAEIDAIGVQVKDLDIGLLDFPCEVDGKIVLLCWKLGENGITHWHGRERRLRRPQADRRANQQGEEGELGKAASSSLAQGPRFQVLAGS